MENKIKELEKQLAEERAEVERLESLSIKARLGEGIALIKEKELKTLCETLQADGEQYRSLLEAKDKVISRLTDKLLDTLEILKDSQQETQELLNTSQQMKA